MLSDEDSDNSTSTAQLESRQPIDIEMASGKCPSELYSLHGLS